MVSGAEKPVFSFSNSLALEWSPSSVEAFSRDLPGVLRSGSSRMASGVGGFLFRELFFLNMIVILRSLGTVQGNCHVKSVSGMDGARCIRESSTK